MPRSLATYTALVALTFGLAGGVAAPAAFAADAPIPGSAACTDAVNSTSNVTDAKATLAAAKQTQQSLTNQLAAAKIAVPFVQATVDLLTGQLNTQGVSVAKAQAALDRTVARATKALCTGTTATTTTPVTPPPFIPRTDDPATSTVPVASFADDKDCADFDSQEAAQTFFLAHRSAAQPDPDRLDANSNGIACEGAFGDAAPKVTHNTTEINNGIVNSGGTVNPTADDGSTATTSGNEVTDVPAGSASTGAA